MRKMIERLLFVSVLLVNSIVIFTSNQNLGPVVVAFIQQSQNIRQKYVSPEPASSSDSESLNGLSPLLTPIFPNPDHLKMLERQESMEGSDFQESDCGITVLSDCPTRISDCPTKTPSDCSTRISDCRTKAPSDCGTKAPSSAGSFNGLESLRKAVSRRSLDEFFDKDGNPICFPGTPLTGRNLSTPGNSSPLKSSRYAGLLSPSYRSFKK